MNNNMSPIFYRPHVGDVWEIKLPNKRKVVKTVGSIYFRWFESGDGRSKRRPVVSMKRLPKGRYYELRVKTLLKYGTRISTAKEEAARRESARVAATARLNAKLAVNPNLLVDFKKRLKQEATHGD